MNYQYDQKVGDVELGEPGLPHILELLVILKEEVVGGGSMPEACLPLTPPFSLNP